MSEKEVKAALVLIHECVFKIPSEVQPYINELWHKHRRNPNSSSFEEHKHRWEINLTKDFWSDLVQVASETLSSK
jgi:hypothetical protein